MKIAVVEDNETLAKQIKMILKKEGYDVEVYFFAETFFDNFSDDLDLILLDINLPGMDGLEALKTLKELKHNIKTIFISSYTNIDYLKEAYSLGCEDYIKKPFDLEELLLKINKIKNDLYNDDKIYMKNYVFDLENFLVIKDNQKIKLTKKEVEILRIFLDNIDKVVPFDYLNIKVWQNEVPINTIVVAVLRLKKKLELKNLENIREVGYIFHKI